MKKKVAILSLLCLLFCTINYTYSAFRNTIEGSINISTNWVFKLNVPNGTKEENYYNVPISGTSGSFDITVDNSKNKYDASYVIKLEPINLPNDIVENLTYEGKLIKDDSETITIKYNSSNSVNGYIKVKVESKKYEYTVMKNGYYYNTGGTEFWNNNYKSSIKSIKFNNSLDNLPSSCTEENLCWDVTDNGVSNKVYGYLMNSSDENSNSSNYYDLYIVSDFDIYAPQKCEYIFAYFTSLKTIDFNNSFDTSNVTSIYRMFDGSSSLVSLDLSSFDTSNIKNMTNMFYECSSLVSLDISSFNTSNVTNMASMLSGCSSLVSLDLSSFDTSKVTDMQAMFYECSSLISLDLSSFDTSKVTNMGAMFSDCSSLISLDLSSFDTSNVTRMYKMFYKCSSLVSLDLSSFKTPNLTNIEYMFQDCSSLVSLDLSNFNTSNLTTMFSMFDGCSSLVSLDLSSFDTSNITNMMNMFYKCSSLVSLDLSSFNTSNIMSMNNMFYGCSSLTTLGLSNFNMPKVRESTNMFYNCSSLSTTINIMVTTVDACHHMFEHAAITDDSQITVNYIEDASDLVDYMIATRGFSGNVIKGSIIPEPTITIEDNFDIKYEGYNKQVGTTITLISISGNNYVTSFKMNGTLIEGNTFTMPDGNVIISDVITIDCITIETNHYPYFNSQNNVIMGEHTFEGASSLTVMFKYNTQYYYDYIYIYDSSESTEGINNNNKYMGVGRNETITINSNYIKITFTSNDSANYYYGFRAIVIPNYD